MKELIGYLARKTKKQLLCLGIVGIIGVLPGNNLCLAQGDQEPNTVTEQTQIISQKLTCLFETGKPKLSVSYVEDLGDGRGYTCGWAGFTTADEEVVQCVEEYTRLVGENPLGAMLPELRRLQEEGDDDTSKLDEMNFEDEWKNAAKTDEFKTAYASVVDHIFGGPAREYVQSLGLQSPVAYAVFFDSVIQHGNSDDPDGVPALIERTKEQAGDPAQNEEAWLLAFLDVRQKTLENPHNRDTASEWRKSVSRVVALDNIVKENSELQTPIQVKSKDYDEEVE